MINQKVLLLNASNMEAFPVYPYAFIQVPAIARQAGIEVVCQDLLGIPQAAWPQTVQNLIEQHHPAMILITLRNIDSGDSQDYDRDGSREGNKCAYFPVDRTRELIAAIREISDLKIVVGGFAFSLLPNELMHYLCPDMGVIGGPDAFFSHFEAVQAGILRGIANLLFFQEGRLVSNPRLLFPPLDAPEYTPQAIEAMLAFYNAFPTPGFQGAPLEIMRGCSHTCVFCAEPHSVGMKVRYRDLAVVMKDVQILADHGITQLYIVSSELNPEGNEFVLELADRIYSCNETLAEDRKISWDGANYLLKFSADEYGRLYRSGFTGGWFDFTALDDENARAMRTPYRNERLLTHLKIYAQCERRQHELRRARRILQAEAMGAKEDDKGEDELPVTWSMFLGNPASTIQTIRDTLRIANREGLPNLFDRCGLNVTTRVFDYEKPSKNVLAATYSITLDRQRVRYRQLLPSFAYPPTLLQDFSEKEIEEMFRHIAETYLSTKYQKSRNWLNFIRQKATAASVSGWMAELSIMKEVHLPAHFRQAAQGKPPAGLQQLFSEEPVEDEKYSREDMARQVVNALLSACLEAFPDRFGSLGLPTTREQLEGMTPYELAVGIFDRWRTEQELLDALATGTRPVLSEALQSFVQFCAQAMFYRFNLQINPQYSRLFVPS